ncbi:MAG TPA: CcoQ/FixQ family Cbb3-type cytochrome c oxidase assembly chaperone [Casimicrobiaceae bacterium]|nr:CcoQ/FixQ family Cbb3-type cytochrome c oxidase assembly chaperone [Casimicrobiaceae bacterium]
MELYSTLASLFTVLSLFVFIGIVRWAWSGRRRAAFAAAAAEPFALPDEQVLRTASATAPTSTGTCQ